MGERDPVVRTIERRLERERSSRESAARAAAGGRTAPSISATAISSARFLSASERENAGETRWRARARRSAFLYIYPFYVLIEYVRKYVLLKDKAIKMLLF